MICFLQCTSPGIVASSEDCRKFWLCKEEEENSRVLEVRIQNHLRNHNLSFAVAAIPMSPWLPLQHRDRPLCKAGGRLLPSGGTARGWLQVNIWWRFFSTPQICCWECTMYVIEIENNLQGRQHHPAECQPTWCLLCALGLKSWNWD